MKAPSVKTPRMQVLISTHRALDKAAAMPLPRVEGVGYLISCQSAPQSVPQALQRPDVEVHFNPTKGLSNNRNAALEWATAPFVLIADDDLTYYAEGLREAMDAFESHPSTDLFFFRFDGSGHKAYPDVEADLSKDGYGYNPASIEIGLRMPTPLRFRPDFGLGAPQFACGEEAMLLLDARDMELGIRFFPITLCSHPDLSTGHRSQTEAGVLRAEGAVIRRRFPATALARLLLKALRTPGNPLRHLSHLLQGYRAWKKIGSPQP